MSPTQVDIKCPIKGCGLPLRVVSNDGIFVICKCAKGHRKQYTKRYFKRFLSPENIRGDLSQECPQCYTPIKERSRTLQGDAKEIGRIECSICGMILLYDPNIHKWVPADS